MRRILWGIRISRLAKMPALYRDWLRSLNLEKGLTHLKSRTFTNMIFNAKKKTYSEAHNKS